MAQNNYRSFGELDREAIGSYVRFVKGWKRSVAYKANCLSMLVKLFQERDRMPVGQRLAFHPFGGLTAGILVGNSSAKHGEFKPFDEAEANEMYAKMSRWLLDHGDTILTFASKREACRASAPTNRSTEYVQRFIHDYTWPSGTAPLLKDRPVDGGHDSNTLLLDLTTACAAVILLCVGPRMHELLSLKTNCIRGPILTEDGTLEIFYLRGRTLKRSPDPTGHEREWVACARPAGSKEIPIVLKAVELLERVTKLFAHSGGYLFCGTKKRRTDGAQLNIWLRRFFPFVSSLSSHRFRKSYARFIAHSASSLSPLAQQLGHIRIAHTMRYVGRDSDLNRLIDDAIADDVATNLLDLVRSKNLAGPLAEKLSPVIATLRATIADEGDFIEIVRRLALDAGIQIYPGWWGVCYFRSENNPKCGGIHAPNFATRCVELCAACSNFCASERYKEYHQNRVREYMRLLEARPLAPVVLLDFWKQCVATSQSLAASLSKAS